MRRIPPFVYGQVGGALIVGAVAGAFLDLKAVMVFSSVLGGAAAVSALVCWRYPGFSAAGWKLWLAGVVANPLFLVAVADSIDEYQCLLGWRSGWSCLFSDVGPQAAGLCLLPPVLGLALHRLMARRARS
ncbi:MAG: hypothetical protein ACHQK9_22945 [Reyranellales bacterium]